MSLSLSHILPFYYFCRPFVSLIEFQPRALSADQNVMAYSRARLTSCGHNLRFSRYATKYERNAISHSHHENSIHIILFGARSAFAAYLKNLQRDRSREKVVVA